MNTLRHAFVAIAIATLGLSGLAEARDHGRADARFERGLAESRHRFDRRVEQRQELQRSRIQEGRERGEISRRELAGLRQDQGRIARMEDRFGADGRYSRHERRTLDRAQDRASHRIDRARHTDHHGHHRHDRRWDRQDHRWHRHDHHPGGWWW